MQKYDIRTDVKFGNLVHMDLAAEAASHQPWFNQTLTQVNDSVVRLAVIEGEFHWHKHDKQDEFFLCMEGQLMIDVEGKGTVKLDPQQVSRTYLARYKQYLEDRERSLARART